MSTISLRYTANGHPSAPAIYRETRADGSTWIVCDGEIVDVSPARAAVLAAAWGPSVWVVVAAALAAATPASGQLDVTTRGAAAATRGARKRTGG